jgi:hypothetical protein
MRLYFKTTAIFFVMKSLAPRLQHKQRCQFSTCLQSTHVKIWEASQCLGRSSPMGWGFSKERSNVIVLNTKAIVKSAQWKALFRATARLPKNLTSCTKSANKPSTSCVRTACPKLSTSLEQAGNNL